MSVTPISPDRNPTAELAPFLLRALEVLILFTLSSEGLPLSSVTHSYLNDCCFLLGHK